MAASALVKHKTNTTVGAAPTETLRGVRCIRLSVRTDETTSPERQREADDIAAAALGIDFGSGEKLREAVDLDVSASKVGPFERPQLGAWLKRPDDFDALVFWRFDRAIRSMGDMHELAKWARKHRKMIVFAEGLGGTGRLVFDFRNPMDPMSELMMMMFAFAAQVETQSTSDRVTGAQAAMRKMPLRWRGGGQPAYGYLPAPMPAEHGGVGWTLVPDPEAVTVIERIIAALVAGLAPLTIARMLNADGVLSPSAHWAAYRARTKNGGAEPEETNRPKRKPAQWRDKTIVKMLTSPAIMGWKMHRGNPVRDDQGAPVMAAEKGILTREEFDQVGALLTPKPVAERPPVRKDSGALLLRVIHCDGCEGRMYLNKGYYQCSSYKYGANCPAPSTVRADWVDEHASSEFLRLVGPVQITRVTEIPGYDPQPEIDATVAEMEEHDEQKGRRKSKAGMAAWQKRADALETRLAELEAREKTEPRREVLSTGRTYGDDWNNADTMARRTMLIDAGARLIVKRGTRGGWRKLDLRRVEFTITGDLDPAIEANVTVAGELATENNPNHAPTPGATAHRNLTPQALATAA
ncbi:recombinase family protein [Streptomyces sp. BPTC-684]|uniref:recombinase family protein n=1 Tax=Streptomyces sp. BPTC-684 TaxID=3043734 RepID=UPI0024B07864|nr:recombinase family protein [Streptomyces sp. BPTC-684]WHM36994.1 recombinase family protein [Streptomyces sp. BPTC-684]